MARKTSIVKQAQRTTGMIMRLSGFSRKGKNTESRNSAAKRLKGLRRRYGMPSSARRGVSGMY